MTSIYYGSGHLPDFVVDELSKPLIAAMLDSNMELYKLLFLPSAKMPPVEVQLYLYMKRFRTQPSEFFSMDRELRLFLYNKEREAVDREVEESKKTSNS